MSINPYFAEAIARQRDRELAAAARSTVRAERLADRSPHPLRRRLAAGLRRGADLLEPPPTNPTTTRAAARAVAAH